MEQNRRTSKVVVMNQEWLGSTVKNLGFGERDRLLLETMNENNNALMPLRGYNEVMLEHRVQRVEQWNAPSIDLAQAIHTVVACTRDTLEMKNLAIDYQWKTIGEHIRSQHWKDLSIASHTLRIRDSGLASADAKDVIGFDWGSCAWRHHCGALADTTEALDELDFMLGVLEPPEAIFCLDVMERSLREILTVVPWGLATQEDQIWFDSLPAYVPHRIFNPEDEIGDEGEVLDTKIDDTYLKALQELSVDQDEEG